MIEIRVLTVPLDPSTGLFDDGPVRSYLVDREVLRAEPHFFTHEGRPCWSVYLETRLRQGAVEPRRSESESTVKRNDNDAERAAFQRLLSELDETERARYERLLQWRREGARREGVPHYVLLTNRQALDLARRAPRTLEGAGQVKGIGRRRLQKHGREILEVLHGPEQTGGTERPAAVREVDGRDELVVRAHGAVSEEAPAQPDEPDRAAGARDSGECDERGVSEGSEEGSRASQRQAESAEGHSAALPRDEDHVA